jgi:hypothetical protein
MSLTNPTDFERRTAHTQRLYGARSSYDRVIASSYDGPIRAAKMDGRAIRAAQLEARKEEERRLYRELGLGEDVAMQVSARIRALDEKPIERQELTPFDQRRLEQRYGLKAADVLNAAGRLVGERLRDKPELGRHFVERGAGFDGDLTMIACEAAVNAGLVNLDK